MADHTDYIRIRGLNSGDAEVFQGLGAVSFPDESEPSPVTPSPGLEWGEIPEDAIRMVGEYTASLNDWMAEAAQYDADSGSRALPPALLANLPVVPLITSIVATGGISLPAVATVLISQVIMNLVGSAISNYAASLDPNSPQNILKKAFLWDNNGTPESILKTAMLRVSDPEKSILRDRLTALITELTNTTGAVTNLEQPLKDLALVDETIQFGDDMKARIKGKALEF